MIGRIRCEWSGETCNLELSDDLRWSCDDPTHGPKIAAWMQALFDPRDDLTPSRGMPGHAALLAAAEWLDAEVDKLLQPAGERRRDGILY